MCTATWIHEADGYQLFFNRDERRARRPAVPPEVRRKAEVRFIAPLDGDFGGTWMAVNERGLSIALLNGYSAGDAAGEDPPGGATSRGLLIPGLIDRRSTAEVLSGLSHQELARFRSFWLIAFAPAGPARIARWDGRSLERDFLEDDAMPLVSSSFDTGSVRRSRRELFARMSKMNNEVRGARPETHVAYHASHDPERGPHSPCMHRPDARTVSFNRIRVDAERIRFDYTPHPPCGGNREPACVELPRLTV